MIVRPRAGLAKSLCTYRKPPWVQGLRGTSPPILNYSEYGKIIAVALDVRSFSSPCTPAFDASHIRTEELHKLLEKGDQITASRFCNGWSIAQLKGGYRYCADDVLCAHLAVSASSTAQRLLELGAGVGTIALLWLGQQRRPFQPSMCTLIEAQEISVDLCRHTLRISGLESAVDVRKDDLRNVALLDDLGGGFDIIVSNPPYLLKGMGALPKHPQKAHCRHELRGDIFDFCKAASSQLAPRGRFVLVHAAARVEDVLAALRASGFIVIHRLDICFRHNLKSIAFVCCLSVHRVVEDRIKDHTCAAINVQEMDGSWTPEYLKICQQLGL